MRELTEIYLTVEGYEALRLAEIEGLTQEEAAERMNVSRHTFGRILAQARKAVAQAVVQGRALRIEGGDYEISGQRGKNCSARSETQCQEQALSELNIKKENKMGKIAVSSEGPTLEDRVDPRFGRAGGFVLFDPESGQTEYLDNGASMAMAQGAGIKAAETVASAGVEVLLTGFVGPKGIPGLERRRSEDRPEPGRADRGPGPGKIQEQPGRHGRRPQPGRTLAMILAVASGKGGTGKTTVSASLASVWDTSPVCVDMDVEEPNLHLFLHPDLTGGEKALMEVPEIIEEKCTKCGACSDVCQFKAISLLGTVLLTFSEMCHGCAACLELCPENALKPAHRELGEVLWGKAGRLDLVMGRLRVGEAMSPPLMREVKKVVEKMRAPKDRDVIMDCPPGVSCPAVNAVMDSDVILLVTEPTPFGFHDFKLAYQAFSPLNIPMGAVINRAGLGDDAVYGFCKEENIPILCEIPFDRKIADAYSRGMVISDISAGHAEMFRGLAKAARELARKGAARAKEAAHA